MKDWGFLLFFVVHCSSYNLVNSFVKFWRFANSKPFLSHSNAYAFIFFLWWCSCSESRFINFHLQLHASMHAKESMILKQHQSSLHRNIWFTHPNKRFKTQQTQSSQVDFLWIFSSPWNKLLSPLTSQIPSVSFSVCFVLYTWYLRYWLFSMQFSGCAACTMRFFPKIKKSDTSPMLAESRLESLKFNFPRNISHSIEYRVDLLVSCQCKLYFVFNCELLGVACFIYGALNNSLISLCLFAKPQRCVCKQWPKRNIRLAERKGTTIDAYICIQIQMTRRVLILTRLIYMLKATFPKIKQPNVPEYIEFTGAIEFTNIECHPFYIIAVLMELVNHGTTTAIPLLEMPIPIFEHTCLVQNGR